jgi:hypothetical protein
VSNLGDIERRLDALTIPLLGPLRASKTIEPDAASELMLLGRSLVETAAQTELVPRSLVGKSWYVFTAMLAEADHAQSPAPILDVAWEWAEYLRMAYGPTF